MEVRGIVTSCRKDGQARILAGARFADLDQFLTGQSAIDASSPEAILADKRFRDVLEAHAAQLIGDGEDAWKSLASDLTYSLVKDSKEVVSRFREFVQGSSAQALAWMQKPSHSLACYLLLSIFNATEEDIRTWLRIFVDSSQHPNLNPRLLFDALIKGSSPFFVPFSSAPLDCLAFAYKKQDPESVASLNRTQETSQLVEAARLSSLVGNVQNACAFHASTYRCALRYLLEGSRLPITVRWNELSRAGSLLDESALAKAYNLAAKPINSELERKAVAGEKLTSLSDQTHLIAEIDRQLDSKQYLLFLMDALSFFDLLMVFDEKTLQKHRVNIHLDLFFVQSVLPSITETNLSAIFLGLGHVRDVGTVYAEKQLIEERLGCTMLNSAEGPWQICSRGEKAVAECVRSAVQALKRGARFAAAYDASFETDAKDKSLPDYSRLSLDLNRLIARAEEERLALVITSDHGWIQTEPFADMPSCFSAQSHHRCSAVIPPEASKLDDAYLTIRLYDNQSIRIMRNAYHPSRVPRYAHGGCTIQELLVPVLMVRGG